MLRFIVILVLVAGCGNLPIADYNPLAKKPFGVTGGYPGAGNSGVDQPLSGGHYQCFYSSLKSAASKYPSATLEHAIEMLNGVEVIHIRLTLDPAFVDNTYGATSIGWADSKKGTHEFKQLVGSDHAQILIADANQDVVMDFKIDYLSEDDSVPSGYRSLGVSGGDGKVSEGRVEDVILTSTSLDRNFNERGHSSYVVDSPSTDAEYKANPETEDWDYRVVYEAWVSTAVYGTIGLGDIWIEFIHASPSKLEDNSPPVDEDDCPDDWPDNDDSSDDDSTDDGTDDDGTDDDGTDDDGTDDDGTDDDGTDDDGTDDDGTDDDGTDDDGTDDDGSDDNVCDPSDDACQP